MTADLQDLLATYKLTPEEVEQLDEYVSINYRVKSKGQNYMLKVYNNADELKRTSSK